jgi:hypothetical protein
MAITDMWYNGEVNSFLPSYYGQANPDPNTFEKWGHFSQVVWNGTTSIGCASVLCPDGSIFQGFQTWFTVCNYYPAGMYTGTDSSSDADNLQATWVVIMVPIFSNPPVQIPSQFELTCSFRIRGVHLFSIHERRCG